MKKILKILAVALSINLLCGSNVVFAESVSDIGEQSLNEQIYEINPELMDSENLKELQKEGKVNEYIERVNEEYSKQLKEEEELQEEEFKKWGISRDTTIAELAELTQKYLDDNQPGITVNDNEFINLVNKMFVGDEYPIEKMAEENPEFGPAYLYMNVVFNDLETNQKREKNETIGDILKTDFDEDFRTSETVEILNDFLKVKASGSVDGAKVQSYAEAHAGTSNNYPYNTGYVTQSRDCTNFASQALYAGGLGMISNSADKTADKYVSTTDRWFYYNNNSNSGYSMSTSWVRVVDLYKFLALKKGFGVYATTDKTSMNSYLNKGFILQGKHRVGDYSHSIVVTYSNGKWCYCGHTSNRRDEPLDTFYNAYYKYRVIQVY